MSVKLEQSWLNLLADQFEQPYFKQIKAKLLQEHAEHHVVYPPGPQIFAKLLQEHAEHHVVYPPGPQIFAALDYCPVDKVKAVIIGQDPYHNPGQAHGLCFSVPFGIEPPPSLVNIFQELHDDLGITPPPHGNLEGWAHQGILLLNASLTVRAHMAASLHGHDYPASFASPRKPRLFALGQLRHQKTSARSPQPRTSHPHRPAPEPALGIPRVLRLQALQQSKRLPCQQGT